jgi:large subunit ribosomal protein L35
MPKMRSHSSTKKRIRVTGSGKFRRGQAGIRHLAPATTSKQSRHLRKASLVATCDARRIRQQLDNIK